MVRDRYLDLHRARQVAGQLLLRLHHPPSEPPEPADALILQDAPRSGHASVVRLGQPLAGMIVPAKVAIEPDVSS